ncbi:MAG: Protein kinase domain [Solimicrobium sp.]|jgi:hypothetical protein|nr:Protein kinase domain [Solimicrobium sp.]
MDAFSQVKKCAGMQAWRDVINDANSSDAVRITSTETNQLETSGSLAKNIASLFPSYTEANKKTYEDLFASIHNEHPNYSERIKNFLSEEYETGAYLTPNKVKSAIEYLNLGLQKEKNDKDSFATVFQKYIRSFNTTEVKEPMADVSALRMTPTKDHPIGEAIAYNILPDEELSWIAFPPISTDSDASGGFKKLTHKNTDYVGLTLIDPTIAKPIMEVLSLITLHHLDKLVPQIRVNERQLISKNLGSRDLDKLKNETKDYRFSQEHFKELASNIDKLHSLGFVHRDIKPANMFFYAGHMYLTDLDTMGKTGEFTDDLGTRNYLSPAFLNDKNVDNNPREADVSAYKKDQYTFLISMMISAISDEWLVSGRYAEKYIDGFLTKMTCSDDKKMELKNFLLAPEKHFLSSLAVYFDN